MGLDMYLYAEVKAPKDSEIAALIREHLTDDLVKEMNAYDPDYPDYQPAAYLSGWTFGDREPDRLYSALSKHLGFTPHEGSPHINMLDDHDGNYRVRPVVFYWRKANAIHRWFVDHVQDGRDECQHSIVHPEVLLGLVDICEQISADHSKKELLTPTSGFFFGSTEYDEWFFSDIKETATGLRTNIARIGPKASHYVYHSSW